MRASIPFENFHRTCRTDSLAFTRSPLSWRALNVCETRSHNFALLRCHPRITTRLRYVMTCLRESHPFAIASRVLRKSDFSGLVRDL